MSWLPNPPRFLADIPSEMRVSELIDGVTGQWDRTIIYAIFAPRTCQEIFALPLNSRNQDQLVWMQTRNHQFSVKSAYQEALRLNQQVEVEHSTARSDGPIWRRIWSLNVPPKFRTFLWRACSNILPTGDNLCRWKVMTEPRCEVCCQESESADHILWDCPLARNVRALSRGRLQKCSNDQQNFFLLFRQLVAKLEIQELESGLL